jgi:hypothetical protein
MASDLLRRVRWRNVGRAVGAVVLIVAVVAWPRLSPPAPRLPDSVDRPLVEPTPRPPAPAVQRPAPRRRPRERARRGVERPREVAPPAARDEVAPARRRPAPPPVSDEIVAPEGPDNVAVTPTPTIAPSPSVDPAQREFGFER